MVFKSIKRMKDVLPDLIHVVMFYDEGTVIQSTFEHPINIPKLGKNLSESLKLIENLLEITEITDQPYKKLIYETIDYVIMVLKLGEHSNAALFFRKGDETPNISIIRRYLYRIEELIDTDKLELDKHALEDLRKELDNWEYKLRANLQLINNKKSAVLNFDLENEKIQKKINDKKQEILHKVTIKEKLEQMIEKEKDQLKECKDIEIQEKLKPKIEENEKELKNIEKKVDEEEKVIKQMKDEIEEIERNKENFLSDINIILEENKKIQEKITEKTIEIAELEEETKKLEKDKFERKFLE